MNWSQQINEVRNIETNKNFDTNVKCKPLFIVDVHLADLHSQIIHHVTSRMVHQLYCNLEFKV